MCQSCVRVQSDVTDKTTTSKCARDFYQLFSSSRRTGMVFLGTEVAVWFIPAQGSVGMAYRLIPSHFKHYHCRLFVTSLVTTTVLILRWEYEGASVTDLIAKATDFLNNGGGRRKPCIKFDNNLQARYSDNRIAKHNQSTCEHLPKHNHTDALTRDHCLICWNVRSNVRQTMHQNLE